MGTWRAPNRLVWCAVVCPQCRQRTRVKLPGLYRESIPRVCPACRGRGAAEARRRERAVRRAAERGAATPGG